MGFHAQGRRLLPGGRTRGSCSRGRLQRSQRSMWGVPQGHCVAGARSVSGAHGLRIALRGWLGRAIAMAMRCLESDWSNPRPSSRTIMWPRRAAEGVRETCRQSATRDRWASSFDKPRLKTATLCLRSCGRRPAGWNVAALECGAQTNSAAVRFRRTSARGCSFSPNTPPNQSARSDFSYQTRCSGQTSRCRTRRTSIDSPCDGSVRAAPCRLRYCHGPFDAAIYSVDDSSDSTARSIGLVFERCTSGSGFSITAIAKWGRTLLQDTS